MDRRILLASIASLAVVPALAQTSGSSAQPGAATGAGSRMNQAGAQMSQADMQHMQQTMQLGMVALETSRIALQKAQNAELKQFAQFEVQEQTTLSEVLRSMMEPAATAATGSASGQAGGAAASGAMQMDAQGREMVQKLQSAQAGAEFDRQYLQGQIQGHQNLLQVQERYLQANPQNREHMNVAKLARGQIREHIALLQDMQQKIR
jgi:putative membrane protein